MNSSALCVYTCLIMTGKVHEWCGCLDSNDDNAELGISQKSNVESSFCLSCPICCKIFVIFM